MTGGSTLRHTESHFCRQTEVITMAVAAILIAAVVSALVLLGIILVMVLIGFALAFIPARRRPALTGSAPGTSKVRQAN